MWIFLIQNVAPSVHYSCSICTILFENSMWLNEVNFYGKYFGEWYWQAHSKRWKSIFYSTKYLYLRMSMYGFLWRVHYYKTLFSCHIQSILEYHSQRVKASKVEITSSSFEWRLCIIVHYLHKPLSSRTKASHQISMSSWAGFLIHLICLEYNMIFNISFFTVLTKHDIYVEVW